MSKQSVYQLRPSIDDNTVYEPSPQRVRNILTLEERVRAIHAYDKRPMYTKVAKMFNCSWEQIKNIVANRDRVLEFHEATRSVVQKPPDPDRDEIRKRKIAFLGECMYEYIQRAQFHQRTDINEELIRNKALVLRNLIQIDKFMPNKPWINHFKATYNISLSNRQITLTRCPPSSLDLKDIMTYCGKNKPNSIATTQTTATAAAAATTAAAAFKAQLQAATENTKRANLNEEQLQRRKRKINSLERALYEYIQRATFHHKSKPLDYEYLRNVALQLRDILKIENFTPDKLWFMQFQHNFDFNISHFIMASDRTPPLSLDLRDILSFCRRSDKEQPPATVTLAPKENTSTTTLLAKKTAAAVAAAAAAAAASKRNSVSARPTNNKETINPSNTFVHQPLIEPKAEESDDDDVIAIEVKHELIEINDDDDNDDAENEPPLKIRKIESLTALNETTAAAAATPVDANISTSPAPAPPHSPGHWSEHSDDDATELPKIVHTYEDALRLLKPLEEFAMLQENYRVIGLISQLEDIFKNAPKRTYTEDDDTL